MTKYECEEWKSLIMQSLADLNDRDVRQKILQHPFNCEHPICKQVALHMTEITGK